LAVLDENVIIEARSVLENLGLQWRHIATLSPGASGRKSSRRTLRIELADGSAIKIRCLESVEEASRLADCRSRLNPAFVPIIVRHGAMLLEPWIDGEELSPSRAAARAEETGALLGRLHATELLDTPQPAATRGRRDRAAEQLATLAESGVISADLSQALQVELLRADPGEAQQTMVHLDYCPENLVVDPGGGLHVVDNEWIRIDASGLDLGRTYARWPMTADVWERFLRGYLTTAPFNPGPLRFWMIVMAAAGAMIRRQKSFAELASPLARLHQLAASVSER
jgi:Ser/Thr protein kinase RdoA (MazF antagonist)